MADCLLWAVLLNYTSSPKFWLLFPRMNVLFFGKKGWDKFWAIFSHTHLVTLDFGKDWCLKNPMQTLSGFNSLKK
jgi:hypothetical protein